MPSRSGSGQGEKKDKGHKRRGEAGTARRARKKSRAPDVGGYTYETAEAAARAEGTCVQPRGPARKHARAGLLLARSRTLGVHVCSPVPYH